MKKPLVVWGDSSIRWVDTIVDELMPKFFKGYWEPFCGGAIVAYNLPRIPAKRIYIGDTYSDLMNVYKVLRHPIELDICLRTIATHKKCDSSTLAEMFDAEDTLAPERAALFILLAVIDTQKIEGFAKWLQRVSVYEGDYSCIQPKSSDLVFIDPPSEFDFQTLCNYCDYWGNEAMLIGTIPDTEENREIFRNYNLTRLRSPQSIELLFRNYGKATHTIQKMPIPEGGMPQN